MANKDERARTIVRRLLRWYRGNARDLPWRRTRDAYRIWLSEIMLQQTRVETVVDYYDRFTTAFPDVASLAAASEDRVLKMWEGLGYYSRARNLLRAARWVVRDGGGAFPETATELERLPGVGRYTAGAVASIAFGEASPVLDGNVKRVLARLHRVEESIDDTATTNRMWAMAAALVDPRSPGDSNQALMELGARVCTPRNPRCDACPVVGSCVAFEAGVVETLPRRRPKKPVPHHDVVALAIRKSGRHLFLRRPSEGLLGGLWEFPGGHVAPNESKEEAIRRTVAETTGLTVTPGDAVASVDHAYSHFKITLHLFRCADFDGTAEPRTHTAMRWLRASDFERYAFPKATLRLLAFL